MDKNEATALPEVSDTNSGNQVFIEKLRDNLPLFFTRQHVSKHLGGLLSSKALAMLDCKHEGPPHKFNMGRRVGYERDSFLAWLGNKMEVSNNISSDNNN